MSMSSPSRKEAGTVTSTFSNPLSTATAPLVSSVFLSS